MTRRPRRPDGPQPDHIRAAVAAFAPTLTARSDVAMTSTVTAAQALARTEARATDRRPGEWRSAPPQAANTQLRPATSGSANQADDRNAVLRLPRAGGLRPFAHCHGLCFAGGGGRRLLAPPHRRLPAAARKERPRRRVPGRPGRGRTCSGSTLTSNGPPMMCFGCSGTISISSAAPTERSRQPRNLPIRRCTAPRWSPALASSKWMAQAPGSC